MYKYASTLYVSLEHSIKLHTYTGGIRREWPIHAMSLDPIVHFKWIIMYMFDNKHCYIITSVPEITIITLRLNFGKDSWNSLSVTYKITKS